MKFNRIKIFLSILSSVVFFLLNFGAMQFHSKGTAQHRFSSENIRAAQPDNSCSQAYLSCETSVNKCSSSAATPFP